MKKLLLFILLLPIITFSQTSNPEDLFPFHAGDYWEYTTGSVIETYELKKDSVTSEGAHLLYYNQTSSYDGGFLNSAPRFKVDGVNVWYNPGSMDDGLQILKLDATDGEQWVALRGPVNSKHAVVYLSENEQSKMVVDVYLAFKFNGRDSTITEADLENADHWQFTEGVGITKYFINRDDRQERGLVGAVVDGDTTGTVIKIEDMDIEPIDFFPHAVGDYWMYGFFYGYEKWSVYKDSVDSEGNTFLYYEYEYSDENSHSGPKRSSGPTQVFDGSNVWGNTSDWPDVDSSDLVYKLDAKEGELWWNFDGVNYTTYAKAIMFDSVEVVNMIIYTFYYPDYIFQDGDSTVSREDLLYADEYRVLSTGFGLSYEHTHGGKAYRLGGAIIDGVGYGVVPVSVEEQQDGVIPTEYTLDQNYPNPFNPSTTINFSIPEAGLVTMKVFNILGQEVTTLINEQKPAGQYTVDFDASNLPSGVYIYSIQSGSFNKSMKMMLLK